MPHPSAMVTRFCPRALRHYSTPRTNSGSVIRPVTPSSPVFALSLMPSNPQMFGLIKMGVSGARFGTTARPRDAAVQDVEADPLGPLTRAQPVAIVQV